MFLPGALVWGYLGSLLSHSVLGHWKMSNVWIFFFHFMAVDAFQRCFLGLQAFALASALGRAGAERKKEMTVQRPPLPIFSAELINLYSLYHSLC